MDAALLRVLVQVNGARQATSELRALDTEATRAGRSVNASAGHFKTSSGALGELDQATRKAAGAQGDLWKDANGKWRNAAGQYASSAEKAAAGIDGLDKNSRKGSKGLARLKESVRFAAGAAGLTGLAVAITSTVRAGVDFEKQMSALGAVSDATGKQMAALRAQAIKAGAATAYSAGEAAQAQTELAKGGVALKDIMGGGLNGALALAAAGELDLAEAAATTANALNLFKLRGRDAGHVADVLATAANTTTGDVADFAMALTQGGAAAKAVGFTLDQTVTALEALALAGVKGSDAGTSLKSAFTQIAKPTAEASKLAKDLGINFFTASGEMKSLPAISSMLQESFGGMTKQQKLAAAATLAGTDGMRALLAITDAGPARLAALEHGLGKQGTAAAIAAEKQKNLAGAFEQFKGSMETVAIIGTSILIPVVTSIVKALTGVVNTIGSVITFFTEGSSAAVALGSGLGVMAAVLTSAAIPAIWSMTKAVGANTRAMLSNPFVLVALALGTLVAALIYAYKESDTFRAIVDAAFTKVKEIVGGALDFITKTIPAAWNSVVTWTRTAWHTVTSVITGAWDTIKSVVTTVAGFIGRFLVRFWTDIRDAAITGWNAISNAIESPVRAVRTWLSERWAEITSAAAAAWRTLRGLATDLWDSIQSRIETPVRGARDTLGRVWEAVSGTAGTAWRGIRTVAGEVWGQIESRILTPARAARDALATIWESITATASDAWRGLRTAAGDFAGGIKDRIVGAFEGAAEKVKGFALAILKAVSHIPGVKLDRQIKDLEAEGFARGGAYARTGGIVNAPITLMGEEAPCIAYGTLIETSMGKRPIQDVVAGELVLTRGGYREVLWSGITRRNAEVLRITSVDGDTVVCTPDHRVWTADGELSGDGCRDSLGSGDLRGRGVLSHHERSGQESVRDAGIADDGPGRDRTLPGYRRPRSSVGSRGQRPGAQADAWGGYLSTGCREAHNHGVSAVAVCTPQSQSAGAACAHRDAQRCGRVLRQGLASLGAGEHLRQSARDTRVQAVQGRGQQGMVANEASDGPRVRAEEQGRLSGVRAPEARGSRVHAGAQGAEARTGSPEACWREARELAVGDWVWTFGDGALCASRVASVELLTERIDTYDLMVDDHHEFVAGGILVHNSHPEFVIPTNPAYRDRAKGLLAQAAGAIGFASGGMYSQDAMSRLWASQGGGDAKIAGAVGMAESGGNPNAANGPYHGLWQVGPGGSFDPAENARQGIAKWRVGGGNVDARWKPWEAYTGSDGIGNDGPFRQYMGSGGLGGAIKGAVGTVTGIMGDLLSKGAGFITDKLPGVGDLPDWIKGLGRSVLGDVTGWIKDKVKGLVETASASTGLTGTGPAGVGTFEGVPMANWVIGALKYARSRGFTGHPTSGYRSHAQNVAQGRNYVSEHEGTQYPHGAVDFGGFTTGLATKLAFTQAVADYKYPLLNPIGFSDDGHSSGTGHKMGGIYGGLPYAGSFAGGGVVPGPAGAPAVATVHGGEVISAPATKGDQSGIVNHFHGDIHIKDDVDLDRAMRRAAFMLEIA